MKALTTSASNVILDKYRDRGVLSPNEFHYRNRPHVLFLPSKKLVNATRFFQQKALQPISALSSDAQDEQETAAQSQTTYESKTVHVKFQLQKECQFGEQFFLVGNEPMLGSWDPTSAIPMEWSDGHIWTVELDIHMGKSIQFKFILKQSTGDFVWQPGRNRILETWETKNSITICEDWENAEYQKIIEEYPTANSEMLVALVSDVNEMPAAAAVDKHVNSVKMLEKPVAIAAENIDYTKKDPVSNASKRMIGKKKKSQAEEESASKKNMMTEEDVLRNNGRAAMIKSLTAENIGHSKEDLVLNATDKMLGEKQVSQPEELVANKNIMSEEDALRNNGRAATLKNLTAEKISDPKEGPELNASNNMLGEKQQLIQPVEEPVAKKNMMTEQGVLGNNARATIITNLASTNVKGNLITHEGDAILVPGAPVLKAAKEEIEDENQNSVAVDVSVDEAMNRNVPKLAEKQDPQNNRHEEKVDVFNEEERHQLGDELKQMTHSAKQEQQPNEMPIGSNVLEHDSQWGRRTLRTFLSNLGLL